MHGLRDVAVDFRFRANLIRMRVLASQSDSRGIGNNPFSRDLTANFFMVKQ
jgi:hypothetical protein